MQRLFSRTNKRRLLIALLGIISFVFLLPQAEVLANAQEKLPNQAVPVEWRGNKTETKINAQLPVNDIKVRKTVRVTVTAYNAIAEQTDSTPCLTADGTNICLGDNPKIVASNWLPFGTKVRIPEYFGDTIFEVHDRMNNRYSRRLDVLLPTITAAKKFGIQQLVIEIL